MNAIILAAGVGHRMINLTRQLNKVLLPVGGIAVIERTIMFLHEAGIDDIVIVTGHKHELFLPLVKKYNVKLVRNKKYSTYNNLYSLQLVLNRLSDTLLIFGDVVLFKNLFLSSFEQTTVLTTFKYNKGVPVVEIETNERHQLAGFSKKCENKQICTPLGITYINKTEALLVKQHYMTKINEKKLKDYKGELEVELLSLFVEKGVFTWHIDSRYALDINLMEEYYQACIKYETFWKCEK